VGKESGKVGYRERWFGAQDGLRLFFRDYGEPELPGTPVLCLTGLTRNSKDFDKLARRFSEDRRVVCLDYRGRGRSSYDDNWRNYRPEVYLSDLLHLLAVCNLHRVVVCGTSMGGLLSMGLAVAAPSVLAGVILNDIGPDLHHRGLSRILEYIGVDQPQPDWEAAVAHLKSLFPRLGLDSDIRWRGFAEATYRLADDGLLHYDWDLALAKPLIRSGGPTADLWKLYGALRLKPVLALRGELSDVFSEETFARMAKLKPDLIQVTVPGVGHPPMLDEAPAETALDDFLAEIDGRQGRTTWEPQDG
jgi:pimeloyl-ACP methyl ester carboxylesterase